MDKLNEMTKEQLQDYAKTKYDLILAKNKLDTTMINDILVKEKDIFKVGTKVKVIKDHKAFNGLIGTVVEISEDFIEDDEKVKVCHKFLVQGDGFKGATKKIDKNKFEHVPNSRWYYAQYIVPYITKSFEGVNLE